jgi:uncharacterized protein YecT (DUF1311 family)
MNKVMWRSLVLVATLFPSLISAAEFDCKTASLASDYVICSRPELIQVNSKLAETWVSVRSGMSVDENRLILNDQKNWLNQLNLDCGLPSRGKPADDVIRHSQMCVYNRIRSRTEELEQISVLRSTPKGDKNTFEIRNMPVRVLARIDGEDNSVLYIIGNDIVPHLVRGIVYRIKGNKEQNVLSRKMHWTPPYLFVLSATGGNCWDCEGVTIFKIHNNSTVRMGDISHYTVNSASPQIEDFFITEYSKLELANGFCHACSPSFKVVVKDVNDILLVDGEATWAINHDRWQENDKNFRTRMNMSKSPPGSEEHFAWETQILPALIANTALAKYCQKADELADLMRFAEPVLDEESYQRLSISLSSVVPLESPAMWNSMAPY